MAADAVNPDFQLIFDSVDSDRSGRICASELQQAMARTGENVSIEGCQLLIGLFDGSTGSIDIQGFAKLVNLHVSWRTIFQSFDKDNSGFIDASEMKNALKKIFKGKVNPINPNPNPTTNQNSKVKFEKEYIDMLLVKFGSSNQSGANPQQVPQFPLTATTTTAAPTTKHSKKGNRLGLDEEQFLLACAFVQKNPPMKESKPDKKKKESDPDKKKKEK